MSHKNSEQSPEREALYLDWQTVEQYLAALGESKKPGTVKTYACALRGLYDFLPASKEVDRETLLRWQENLRKSGYSPQTINARLTVANELMRFWGHREFQYTVFEDVPSEELPKLTREEYRRLLSMARTKKKHRLYLMIKLFGNTEIQLQELPLLTVEALAEDCVTDGSKPIHIPDSLRQELLTYAMQEGICTGMIFQTRTGGVPDRSNIFREIKKLCADARIPEEKANPRCLRRMWQEKQQKLQEEAMRLVWKMQDQMLASEERTVAYKQRKVRKNSADCTTADKT